MKNRVCSLLAAMLLLANCASCAPAAQANTPVQLVEAFGKQLQNVSLLGPEEITAQAIRENYGAYLTPALLRRWLENPGAAVGRFVSSPWPDRIEVTGEEKITDSEYEIKGDIVLLTSSELIDGGTAERQPIILRVVRQGTDAAWKISDVTF